MSNRMMFRKGFTLIELIITIVLLGIIMVPLGIMSIELVKGAARADATTRLSSRR